MGIEAFNLIFLTSHLLSFFLFSLDPCSIRKNFYLGEIENGQYFT
jgi:hypothetical protein